jgi:chromosome segregation ATPase
MPKEPHKHVGKKVDGTQGEIPEADAKPIPHAQTAPMPGSYVQKLVDLQNEIDRVKENYATLETVSELEQGLINDLKKLCLEGENFNQAAERIKRMQNTSAQIEEGLTAYTKKSAFTVVKDRLNHYIGTNDATVTAMRNDIDAVDERLKTHVKTQNKSLKEIRKGLKDINEIFEDEKADARTKRIRINKRCGELTERLETLEEQMHDYSGRADTLDTSFNGLRKHVNGQVIELTRAIHAEVANREEVDDEFEGRLNSFDGQYTTLRQMIRGVEDQLNAYKTTIEDQLNAYKTTANRRIAGLTIALDTERGYREEIQDDLEGITEDIETLDSNAIIHQRSNDSRFHRLTRRATDEREARTQGDRQLTEAVAAETTARTQADTAETQARTLSDAAEAQERQDGDNYAKHKRVLLQRKTNNINTKVQNLRRRTHRLENGLEGLSDEVGELQDRMIPAYGEWVNGTDFNRPQVIVYEGEHVIQGGPLTNRDYSVRISIPNFRLRGEVAVTCKGVAEQGRDRRIDFVGRASYNPETRTSNIVIENFRLDDSMTDRTLHLDKISKTYTYT